MDDFTIEYPAFYEEHIQQAIMQFKEACQKNDHAVGFIFITDIHIHLNGRASVPLILEIGKGTGVNTVLCGGDHCWAYGSKAQCLADFNDSLQYMDPIRDNMQLYHARGNHDATVRSSSQLDTGFTMPYEHVQQAFYNHSSPANGFVDGKIYYYADDTKAKVRYIILDTSEYHHTVNTAWGICNGMEYAQLKWLADVALRVPDREWGIIVIGHIPCAAEMPGYAKELDELRLILEAYKHKMLCDYGDFRSAKGELIAYLCGHSHKDRDFISNGVLHISTGCDSYCKDDGIPRDVGKIENTLFDLFLLDKEKRVLRSFRIGAGSDRTFSY